MTPIQLDFPFRSPRLFRGATLFSYDLLKRVWPKRGVAEAGVAEAGVAEAGVVEAGVAEARVAQAG